MKIIWWGWKSDFKHEIKGQCWPTNQNIIQMKYLNDSVSEGFIHLPPAQLRLQLLRDFGRSGCWPFSNVVNRQTLHFCACVCSVSVSPYLLVCHQHSSDPLLTLKFSFRLPVCPTSLLFPEGWHWGCPGCNSGRGGWRKTQMRQRRRGRRRRKGGGERAHIHSTDGFPLFPHTHSLSQTHPLLRGRQEREGAGGRRGKRIMLERRREGEGRKGQG